MIAHRGASKEAPESTKAAYSLAVEQGADYLEADLQRTLDGEIVVFHNRCLKSLSNVEGVFPDRENYNLENFRYQELKKLDFGSWFNQKYPNKAKAEFENLKILSLRELLAIAEIANNSTGLFLEFKHPDFFPGIEKETIKILAEKGWLKKKNGLYHPVNSSTSRLVFISFNIHSLDKVKKMAPDCLCILLINDNMIGRRSWKKWLELANNRVNGLGPKGFVAWPWHIAAAHDKELFVAPYVINQIWQAKIMSHFKADAYITDKPGSILNFLGRIDRFV
ncbi:MAG: glycerophosphodiester phosphodiesterase family protein [bacterium]